MVKKSQTKLSTEVAQKISQQDYKIRFGSCHWIRGGRR
jgi:hypothetical protein